MGDTSTDDRPLSLTGKVMYGLSAFMVPGYLIVSMNGPEWDALGQTMLTFSAAVLGVSLAMPEYMYKPKALENPNVLKSYLDWGFVASLEHDAGYSHMPESLAACVDQECVEKRSPEVKINPPAFPGAPHTVRRQGNVFADQQTQDDYAVASQILDHMDDYTLEETMDAAYRFLDTGLATPNEVRKIEALLDIAEMTLADDPRPKLSPVAQIMSGNTSSLDNISAAFTAYQKNPDGDPLKHFQTRKARPIDQINYQRVRNL